MKKRKLKKKNIILLILLLIFFITFIISSLKIIFWFLDNNKTTNQIEEIDEVIKIEEVIDNENTEIIEQEEEISPFNPYWDYIKLNLINVDFSELKLINNEVKGWLQVNGTNINYPVVQAKDNKYYLTHSFDKSYNKAGWVFLDYRNNINNEEKNTIIYAHGRVDKTMFGSLRNIIKSNWYNNKDNYVIKMSTENQNTLWQVFSVYKIKTTNDYIRVDFNNDEDYLEFLNLIKNRSVFDFNTSITEKDKIITLSTCYNDSEKVVMHAKLIKSEKR